MLLQSDQPQVRLLVLLRGGAPLLFLLNVHPPRQPDDRQGEGLLFHAHWQFLQEHPHVRQLYPKHQVLAPAPSGFRTELFCKRLWRRPVDSFSDGLLQQWNLPRCLTTSHYVIYCFAVVLELQPNTSEPFRFWKNSWLSRTLRHPQR